MARRHVTRLTMALAVIVAAGALFVMPGPAAGQPAPGGPRERLEQMCAAALPAQTAEPILAKYRDRFRAAREAAAKEERALLSLLVADNSTRAAVDAQTQKTEAARSAITRLRLDMLWELRSIIPAQNREAAFRCAERLLLRRSPR